MMRPTDLAALIRDTPGPGPSEETPVALVLVAVLDEPSVRARWIALLDAVPDYLDGIEATVRGTDDPFDPSSLAVGSEIRITIGKVQVPGELRMLLQPWTKGWWSGLAGVDHVRIAEMEADCTFTTCRSRFQTWCEDPLAPFAPVEPLHDPRTLSQDLTGTAAVETDLRPWIGVGSPKMGSRAYSEWRSLASRRLLAALADRVSGGAAALEYYFGGPPSCTVALDDAKIESLFDRLTSGASWVFVEGRRDADTRHLLLANEWARSYRKARPEELGDGALASAKGAYSAYVKAGSKETLKAIADLRKAVVDEAQKISQRAQDLAGAMWKDLAVAAAPFVLKIFADTARIPNARISGGLAIVAALFLVFSFSMMVWINARYFKRQDDARKVWSATLNTVLTPNEIDEFSEQPIRLSVNDYKAARLRVGLFYGLLVAVLAVFAWSSLCPSAGTAPKGETASEASAGGAGAQAAKAASARGQAAGDAHNKAHGAGGKRTGE